jgi:membrane-bound serine protease (ClpP class)
MVDNIIFEFEFHATEAIIVVLKSFVIVSVAMLVSFILSLYLSKKMLTSKSFSWIVLNSTQKEEEGFIGVNNKQKELIGSIGKASTDLRPSGKVEINEEIYDAVSEIGFIDKGQEVKVIDFRSGQIYVMKVD